MSELEEDRCFGPAVTYAPDEKQFWDRHAPVVRAWIEEGLANGTIPYVDEARQAAFCLVWNRVFAWLDGGALGWEGFDLDHFLWEDLPCGGSVVFYDPRRFFHRTREILERFGREGLLGDQSWRGWVAGLQEREEDLVRFFGGELTDEEMFEIRARYLGERIVIPGPVLQVVTPAAEPIRPAPRRKPSPAERRAKRTKRKAQRAARRASR